MDRSLEKWFPTCGDFVPTPPLTTRGHLAMPGDVLGVAKREALLASSGVERPGDGTKHPNDIPLPHHKESSGLKWQQRQGGEPSAWKMARQARPALDVVVLVLLGLEEARRRSSEGRE